MFLSYDIFSISIAAIMLGYVYGESVWSASTSSTMTETFRHLDNTLEPGVDFGLKVASPIGNLFGQVLFGWLADVVGRKRMCKSERLI